MRRTKTIMVTHLLFLSLLVFIPPTASVEVQCKDSTAILNPSTPAVLGVGGGSDLCQYHFGCLEHPPEKSCQHAGQTAYSWTAWGAYYCPDPPSSGGGFCNDSEAGATDGALRVRLKDDTAVREGAEFWYENGVPYSQNYYQSEGGSVNEVFASDWFGLEGSFGGWLQD